MSKLYFTPTASAQLKALKDDPAQVKRYRKVRKQLGFLETDTKHSSLNVHKVKYRVEGVLKSVWEAYVENNTPGAWRIFFDYGPGTNITIKAITAHP